MAMNATKRDSTSGSGTAAADDIEVPARYEDAVAELEGLVQRLESGQMSLDETLGAYARGAALLRSCRERLHAVEQQIQVLDGGELKPYANGGTPAGSGD